MSKRALWLASSALSVGFIVISCNGSDGGSNGGGGDAGDSSSAGSDGKAGSKGDGGSNSQAGESAGNEAGGPGNEAGTGAGGSEANGGQPGGAGETSVGGEPALGGATSEGGAAGAGAVEGNACDTYADCETGEYCRKATCEASAPGVCMPATRAAEPVCGCDGVTYYTATLANAAEVAVRAPGVCSAKVAVECEEAKCAEGQTCGRVQLRANSCLTKVTGICWQLPKACPKDTADFSVCDAKKCATLCQAVESGEHAIPGGIACGAILP